MIPVWFCALGLLAVEARGLSLEQPLRLSLRASESSSPEDARSRALDAFGGTGRACGAGYVPGMAGEVSASGLSRGSARLETGALTLDAAGVPTQPPEPGQKHSAREILGRKPGEEPEGAGRPLRKAGMAGLGFIVGLAFGSIVGAAAATYAVWTSPNPDLKPWKPLLLLPAVAAGAVVGQLAAPFILADIFEEAESYD